MVGNILCNFLVMFIIIRTKQISSTACKIMFQISFADFLVGSITQPCYMVALLFRETLCILEFMYTFIGTGLVSASLYTIGLLGVDRYIRIKYPTTFEKKLPTRRVYIIMLFLWVLACIRATSTLKSYLDEKQIFLLLNSMLAGIVFLAMIILQTISVYAIRHVTKISSIRSKMRSTNQRIIKLSSRTITMFLVLGFSYTIIVIAYYVYAPRAKGIAMSNIEFVFVFGNLLMYANSLGNSILFLVTNLKARKFIKRKITENIV